MSDRAAELVSAARRPSGRSTVTIRCPFCSCVTEARTWSLAGSGKRCDCGVVLVLRLGMPWAIDRGRQ